MVSRRRERLAAYLPPVKPDRRVAALTPWELMMDPRLTLTEKAVAGLLGGHMNEEGWCCPGAPELARLGGCSLVTVRRALRKLRQSGWLDVTPRYDARGRMMSPYYRWRHPTGGLIGPKLPPQRVLGPLLALHKTGQRAAKGSRQVVVTHDHPGSHQGSAEGGHQGPPNEALPERSESLTLEPQKAAPIEDPMVAWERVRRLLDPGAK